MNKKPDPVIYPKPLIRLGSIGDSLTALIVVPLLILVSLVFFIGFASLNIVSWLAIVIAFILSLLFTDWTHVHFYQDKIVIVRWLWGKRQVVLMSEVVEVVERYGRFSSLNLVFMQGGMKVSKIYEPHGYLRGKMKAESYFKLVGFKRYENYEGMWMRHWVNPVHWDKIERGRSG